MGLQSERETTFTFQREHHQIQIHTQTLDTHTAHQVDTAMEDFPKTFLSGSYYFQGQNEDILDVNKSL